jgi:hypothetical protein
LSRPARLVLVIDFRFIPPPSFYRRPAAPAKPTAVLVLPILNTLVCGGAGLQVFYLLLVAPFPGSKISISSEQNILPKKRR